MPSDLLKNIKHTGTGVPASRAFQVILLFIILTELYKIHTIKEIK